MAEIEFDPALPPEENIRRFFDHLRTVDEGLAGVLEAEIDALIPLPEIARRTKAREAFYKAVRPRLEPQMPGTQERES